MLKEVKAQKALKYWNSESAEAWEKVGSRITQFFDHKRYPHLNDEDVGGCTVCNRTLNVLGKFKTEDNFCVQNTEAVITPKTLASDTRETDHKKEEKLCCTKHKSLQNTKNPTHNHLS